MAKLLLLLVLACFQVSLQKALGKPQFELIRKERGATLSDGKDKNQQDNKKDEDEKFLERIKNVNIPVLLDSDEDYDDVISFLEETEKALEEFLTEIDDDDDDDDEDYKHISLEHAFLAYLEKMGKGDQATVNDFFSWLLNEMEFKDIKENKDDKKRITKRFSSV